MAVYKVPQDVEADDKLLGPFSFRQFIYLMIVAAAIGIAWMLSNIFIGLAVLPLPIVLFFGALALPLKKDQPMETYMAALVSFYLKPKTRLWKQDGKDSLVEITVPKTVETRLTKDLSQDETSRRLSYLANIADTEGWSIKNGSTSMREDIYVEAINTEDMLDNEVATNIDNMISKKDEERRNEAISSMRTAFEHSGLQQTEINAHQHEKVVRPLSDDTQANNTTTNEIPPITDDQPNPIIATTPDNQPAVTKDPNSNNQPIPNDQPEPKTTESTSATAPSPDIIKLASNNDLSIETIAKEARRLSEKEGNEVYISLR
jgi:hypothetical protein